MEIHLLPCPFCGGVDVSITPKPNMESRYRVKCNTCHAEIVDDRKDKVHQAWNLRNVVVIAGQVIYLQPNLDENPLYPHSSVQAHLETLANAIAEFRSPADNKPEEWQDAQQKAENIANLVKVLYDAIKLQNSKFEQNDNSDRM